jgi:large subunit ribosomal protein L4
MQVPVYSMSGEVLRYIDIADSVFAVPANEAVVHQAVLRQLANARQGTACAKTRGEVAGSTRKLYQQKHTGRARSGSMKSPLRRGGGVIFPPRPRSYRQTMPKNMRRLAIRCALSAKAGENDLMVLDKLAFDQPKTKDMVNVLNSLSVSGTALVATCQPEESVILSARNLPGVKTTPARLLNIIDLTTYKKLLMTEEAVRQIEEMWGGKQEEGK